MTRVLYLPLLALLLWPTAALAADGASTTPPDQIWALAAGAIVPLATYVLNKLAPWTSEPVKAMVLVVASAVAGGIVQAITAGDVGFNKTTLGFVVAAIVGAFGAHSGLWRPSGIGWHFGAGQNKQGQLANLVPGTRT